MKTTTRTTLSRLAAGRPLAVLGTAALCLGVLSLAPTSPATATAAAPSAAAADADPEPDKGEPDQPQAEHAHDAPDCTLTRPDRPDDEFSHCSVVDAKFLSTPKPGGTATVQVTVRSTEDVDGVLQLSANDTLQLRAPAGFANRKAIQSGAGAMSAVSSAVALTANVSRTYTFEVKASGNGFATVRANLKTGKAQTSTGDEATVVLGKGPALSPNGGYATVQAPANAPGAPAFAPTKYEAAPIAGTKGLAANAPGASCATGRWVFNNEVGAQEGSENVQIEVYDDDSATADDLLAQGVTGANGNYNICFESTDADGGGGQEVFVRFITSNSVWRVRDTAAANNNYVWTTGVINIADPGTANFGTLQPADPAQHRALHAFDGINLFWYWINGVSTYFDDPGDTRQMIINWTPTSTDGTYYSTGANDIHLAAADPDSDHTTIHEGSHALMDAIYNDAFPPAPNCNPHSIFGNSSTGCAWTEGWAEWIPARVLNDPFYRWADGNSLNLETPTWNDGRPHGDQNEGRIAGTLIDLSDNNNEGNWDRYGEAEAYGAEFEEIYTTSRLENSGTLQEYFTVDRPGEGSMGFAARTAVFQNTNNYAAYPQREPLTNGAELNRPSLTLTPTPHNYSFVTPSGYWSGVGIRGGNDNDLALYDDEGQATLLQDSTYGGTEVDYALVDSNGGHRPVGDTYFPRARLFSGSGAYNIEYSADSVTHGVGTVAYGFTSADVLRVRDVNFSAGTAEYIRVVPTAGLNVGLHLHAATSTASTWVQDRAGRVAESYSNGAGTAESIVWTPPAGTATFGALVLTNQGGSGTATVYRDQSAPTGSSVSINGGAATTTSTSATLTLSAGDANTGIMDMRISTDGVLDTEAWEPYVTSKAVTLPAGVGTKTVFAQFRNNAGFAAAAVSDTISLIAAPGEPAVTTTTPAAGAVTVAFSAPANNGSPISQYQVQCTSPNGGSNGNATGSASPITVTGLTATKQYRCRVRATNAAGTGSYGAYGATVTLPAAAAPAAPTVTNSTPGSQSVTVAFAPNGDGGSPITQYQVQCASTDGGANGNAIGTASPITVTGLTASKTYHCRVRATNAIGTGPYGAYGADVLLPGPVVPPAPTVTNSVPSQGAVTVTFSPNGTGGSPITGYQVRCISTNGGVNGNINGATTTLKVTGLSGGKTYHCQVRATNAIGTGPYSGFGADVVLPAGPPLAPAVTSSTPGAGTIQVAFAASSDGGSPITGYQVRCTSSNGGGNGNVNGAASPLTVTGLTSGRTYTCQVRATNAIGTSPYGAAGAAVVVG